MNIEIIEPKARELNPQEISSQPIKSTSPQTTLGEDDLRNPEVIQEQSKLSDMQSVEEMELAKVSNALEQFWDAMGVSLKFQVDKRTDVIQVEVIDPSTDKVIRKIPADEILNMAASIQETAGFLVDKNL